MKLFLLYQSENTWYDTYDSCVVCAENKEDAKNITPDWNILGRWSGVWGFKLDDIYADEIWTANKDQERGVIIASFNAG